MPLALAKFLNSVTVLLVNCDSQSTRSIIHLIFDQRYYFIYVFCRQFQADCCGENNFAVLPE